MHTGEKLHPWTECEKSLVEMEFWRTICSTTMEKSRTDAQSVESQSRKVVILDLIFFIHTGEKPIQLPFFN